MKLYKKLKLGSRGFSHVEAFIAIVIIAVIAFIGVRVLISSHATTLCDQNVYSAGSSGTCVSTIQTIVNYYNAHTSPSFRSIKITGNYGLGTKEAVKYFQSHAVTGYSLSATGITDATTWQAICSPKYPVGSPPDLFLWNMLSACGNIAPYKNSSSNPSGQSIPTTPPAGYSTVFTDDFTGSSLSSQWHPYYGQPGTDVGGWWDQSHVGASGGMLVEKTYKDPTHYAQKAGKCSTCPAGWDWVEGGVSLWPDATLTDGEYLVRSKVTNAIGVTQVEILFPYSNQWPPEIDFNESNGTNESTATFISGLSSGGGRIQTQAQVPSVDLTQWHTWGVIVTPSTISYLLDGKVWATMANTQKVVMHLTIQQQVWQPGDPYEHSPSSLTPPETDLDVDWVAVYAPN